MNNYYRRTNRIPFNDSTAIGYSVCYGIQLSGSASICSIIYTVNSLFFGICWYNRTLLFDLISIFDEIDELYASDKANKNEFDAAKTKIKCHQLLKNYTETHISITR